MVTVTQSAATAPVTVTVTGLSQNGTLTLTQNEGGVTLNGAKVSGLVHVEDNGTGASSPAITVAGNNVNGSLYCTGNAPDPADGGKANTVTGTASGQCAAIAQR